MPYYVYAVKPMAQLEQLAQFDAFQEASTHAKALRAASYAAWSKGLQAHLYETARANVLYSDALKLASKAGETEGEFRARLTLAAREKRDAAVAELRLSVEAATRSLDRLRDPRAALLGPQKSQLGPGEQLP